MSSIQTRLDKASIYLSIVCMFHCLILPLMLVFVPSLMALSLEGEAFHGWILLTVLPMSVCALILGCRKHRLYRYMIIGSLGLLLLVLGVALSYLIGEVGERIFTVLGACMLGFSHFNNYQICEQKGCSDCGQHQQ